MRIEKASFDLCPSMCELLQTKTPQKSAIRNPKSEIESPFRSCLNKIDGAVSLRSGRNICSHTWSVFCGTCGEVQKNDPERAEHAAYVTCSTRSNILSADTPRFASLHMGYKYVIGSADY